MPSLSLCNTSSFLTSSVHLSPAPLCRVFQTFPICFPKCPTKSLFIKAKSKFHPRTGHEGPEGELLYSSTLPSTSALEAVGGQRHAPAALPPGKTRYPLYRRLGGHQGRSGRMREISPPPPQGFDPRNRPARSESLFRLSYPGRQVIIYRNKK